MPSQLQIAGSQVKPTKWVPIYTSRFFQGLWTQRSPLRPGAIGWQAEKYYGSHNDCLIDGENTEISNRLTLIRRPGTSVYNNQAFPPILSYFSFRLFNTTTEAIKVIADTANIIYDATGPSTKQAIYTKTQPNPARFLSIGNILYFADGNVNKKWLQSLNVWAPSTSYSIGDYFIDSNGNIQAFSSLVAPLNAASYNISSTSYNGTTLHARVFSNGLPGPPTGTTVSLSGLNTHPEASEKGGPVVASTFVTPYAASFPQACGQRVLNNQLFITVPFTIMPPSPTLTFPVGASASFSGTVDSPDGGGGLITGITVDLVGNTITFAVPYVHADYAFIPTSITNLTISYGDLDIEIDTAAFNPIGPTWTDIADTGTVSVGAGFSSLSNIGLVSISNNVLTLYSNVGGYVNTFNPGVTVLFAGFTNPALTFLNGKTAVVISNTHTLLTCAFVHTDLTPAVLELGAATATLSATSASPAPVTSVTISGGTLTCACVNTFQAGSAVLLAGFATATELNNLQVLVATDSGTSFTAPVALADRGATAEGAATAQEITGLITILDGTLTVTQTNSYDIGQSVTFSGLTNAAFLNGASIVVENASPTQFSGEYPNGTAVITQVSVTTNVATITANNQYTAGQVVSLFTNLPPNPGPFPTEAAVISATPTSFTIAATYNDIGPTPTFGCTAYLKFTEAADTGFTTSTSGTSGSAVSGTTVPNFNNLAGSYTLDGNIQWLNHGSALQKMGIDGPVLAPTVASVLGAAAAAPTLNNHVWKANAYFGQANTTAITIVDNSISPGPYMQVVTQPGITGLAQPVWNTTLNGTTTDGTVIWTNKGVLGRVPNSNYQVGDRIAVLNYRMTVFAGYTGDPNRGGQPKYNVIGPFSSYFICTTAGTTANVSSTTIKWSPSPSDKVTDGSVTWKNDGSVALWPGATTDLNSSGVGSIVDSNGNIQNVLVPGTSGATQPTWAKVQGNNTPDGTIIWTNAGPASGGTTSTTNTDQTSGSWYYGYAFKNSFTGEVSNMSPISQPIVPGAGIAVSVSGQGSSDPQADTIELYRTLQGGSSFFFLADISTSTIQGGSWRYMDVSPDPPSPSSTMNTLIAAAVNLENSPALQGTTNLAFHLNRIWGSSGNVVVFSNPPGASIGASYSQFPPLNYFTFSSKVTRLWPLGTAGILVFTVSDIYIITGTTTAAFSPFPFLKGVGLSNYNALTMAGSIIYMFTTDGQLITLDPNAGVAEVGFPIGDLLKPVNGFDPTTVYVTWHAAGSEDKALYVADGATGWFRLSPTASPESGLMWSPFAAIVGGTSAVQSIEVAPGVFRLLIGS